MRGEILHYDVSQGIGFISADDGSRYMFSRNDLQQSQRVGKGTRVDFRADGQNAREVFIVDPRGPAAPQTPAQPQQQTRTSVPHSGPALQPGMAGAQPWAPATPHRTETLPSPPMGYAPPAMPEMSLWGYFAYSCTAGYGNFRDRARRKEYWGFFLFYFLGLIAAVGAGAVIDGALGNFQSDTPYMMGVLGGLALLFFIVPGIAVNVRRFHDVGLSGWLYLLFIVLSFIYIGSIIIFVISLLPSQKHDNKWGLVPAGVLF